MATILADSASQTDVATAVAAAVDGDTVEVPSGSGTWTDINIAKAITLQGAGVGVTNITLGEDGLSVVKDAGGVTYVQGFSFSKTGGGNESKGIIVDGSWLSARPVVFQNNDYVISNSGLFLIAVPGGVIIAASDFEGLWDDSFIQPKSNDGQNSWTTADTLGDRDADGEDNIYVEDCTFLGGTNQGIDADDYSRVVYRYNDLTYSSFNSHGFDTSPAGVRHFEVYNNVWHYTWTGGSPPNDDYTNQRWQVWIRGGTGFIYGNEFTDLDSSGYWGALGDCIRFSIRGAEDDRPQGACGSVSYPVPHQLGQSHDGVTSTTDPIRYYTNTAPTEPVKVTAGFNWGNPCGFTFSTFWQEDRDYVEDTAKPGYAAYEYPHPLRNVSTPTNNLDFTGTLTVTTFTVG